MYIIKHETTKREVEMNIENRMVLEQPKIKQNSIDVKQSFSDYCDKEASLSEFLELFYEVWSHIEVHSFILNGTYQNELNKFKFDYAEYLINQSGIDIKPLDALEILGDY